MAIQEVTSPPFLDDTAQTVVSKLDAIKNAINPNAQGVSYSHATSGLSAENVQEGIDEVKGITDNISNSLTQYNVIDLLATIKAVYTNISSSSRIVAYIACGNIMIMDFDITTSGAISSGSVDLTSLIPKPKNDFHATLANNASVTGFAQYLNQGTFFLRLPSATQYRGQLIFIV